MAILYWMKRVLPWEVLFIALHLSKHVYSLKLKPYRRKLKYIFSTQKGWNVLILILKEIETLTDYYLDKSCKLSQKPINMYMAGVVTF